MKKLISILITLSFILASCSSDEPEDLTDSGESTGSDSSAADEAPEAFGYGGEDFRIGVNIRDGALNSIYLVDTESETAETYNDALYARNRNIEEVYNLNIVSVNNTVEAFLTSIMAGSDDYEAFQLEYLSTNMNRCISDQMVYDLKTLGVDLSSEWYDHNANSQIELEGKLYCLFSDMTLGLYDSSICLAFNKGLMNEYVGEDPYELVKNGEWTVDKFNEMMTDVTLDLNGDSVMDSLDQWGSVSGATTANALYIGFGGKFSSVENGNYVMDIIAKPNADYLDKIFDVMYNKSNFQITETMKLGGSDTDVWQASSRIFDEGRMLFRSSMIQDVRSKRAIEEDFGLLPYPKFDIEQDKYYTYPHMSVWQPNAMVIPVTESEPEQVMRVLDVIAYYSSKTTIPAYYDNVLTGKTIRDDDSADMLDVIFENIVLDFGLFYNIGEILTLLPNMAKSENRDYISQIETRRNTIQARLDEFIDIVK